MGVGVSMGILSPSRVCLLGVLRESEEVVVVEQTSEKSEDGG